MIRAIDHSCARAVLPPSQAVHARQLAAAAAAAHHKCGLAGRDRAQSAISSIHSYIPQRLSRRKKPAANKRHQPVPSLAGLPPQQPMSVLARSAAFLPAAQAAAAQRQARRQRLSVAVAASGGFGSKKATGGSGSKKVGLSTRHGSQGPPKPSKCEGCAARPACCNAAAQASFLSLIHLPPSTCAFACPCPAAAAQACAVP